MNSEASAVITWCISSAQHRQTRTQTKKRWGPALGLWQGLVALARAKLRKQQRKIRLHKEKPNYQPKHRTHKAANKKAACRKETEEPLSHTAKERNKEHQTCMRRIDRKQPTVGRLCIGQPPTGGGRSLDLRYPQNRAFHLIFGFCVFMLV